jgi:hypothetical protein
MPARYSFAMIALFMLVALAACGGEPGDEAAQPAVEEAPEETVEEVVEADEVPVTVMDEAWARVVSTNGGYVNLEVPIDWSSIGSQQVYVAKYSNYSSCRIFIANFETDGDLSTLARDPGQGVIRLSLRLPPESDPLVGTYDLTRTGEDFTGEAGIMVTGGSTITLSRSSMTAAVVEITHVTGNIVAGTFEVADNWTTMSGAFQAEIR